MKVVDNERLICVDIDGTLVRRYIAGHDKKEIISRKAK